TVESYGGYGNATGHLDRGQESVQTVHSAALEGDADDGEGGVAGKGTGQVSGHASGTDEHAEAVFAGRAGKFSGLHRSAVSAHDVGLVGDAVVGQLLTGTLYHRPVRIRTHDNCDFFTHCSSLLYNTHAKKQTGQPHECSR